MRILVSSFLHRQSNLQWATYELEEIINFVNLGLSLLAFIYFGNNRS
jgi:hypothetical protein